MYVFITTQPIPLFVCRLWAGDGSCTNYPADFPIFIVWYFGHKIFIDKGKIQILYIQICIKNVKLLLYRIFIQGSSCKEDRYSFKRWPQSSSSLIQP